MLATRPKTAASHGSAPLTTRNLIVRVGATLLCGSGLLLGLIGCGPEIGDPCESNYDCAAGSMICDTTAPDGYCTRKDCWADEDCPNADAVLPFLEERESVCIPFDNDERYCMRRCDEDDDCRDGYACTELIFFPAYLPDLEQGTRYCYWNAPAGPCGPSPEPED